jgi:hypothetical protein
MTREWALGPDTDLTIKEGVSYPYTHTSSELFDAIERLTRERDALFESAQKCSQKLSVMFNERDAAERKVERLREAIRSAYVEGWTDATSRDDPRGPGVIDQEWETSLARAALDETD